MPFLKSLLTTATLGAVLASASAQIGIGIQGGFINSNATYESVLNGTTSELNTESITGWTVGIPLELSLSKLFALQPELNLLRRGYDFGGGVLGEGGVEYTVVSIPVLAKLGYVGDAFTAAAVFGPAFQYVASGSARAIVGGVESTADIDFGSGFYEDFNRTAVYGIVGAQAGIPLGFGKLVVDPRYRFQLNDEDGRDNIEVRGRGFSVTAGLIFTLGSY